MKRTDDFEARRAHLRAMSDEELEAIMLRLFGPIKRKQYSEPRLVSGGAKEKAHKPKSVRTQRNMVIVDGYNLIHADENLKKTAFDRKKKPLPKWLIAVYAVAFVVLVLLQIFLVDNISISVYFHPLIYVAFIILLPLDTKPVWMVLNSALIGLMIDVMTGMGGLNVIATTATGFLRPWVVNLVNRLLLLTDCQRRTSAGT